MVKKRLRGKDTRAVLAARQAEAIEAMAFANAEAVKYGTAERWRPYDKETADVARVLCANGATLADLASFFAVSIDCIRGWATRHDKFRAALREGRDAITDVVEQSMAMKATGFWIDTEKVFCHDGEIIRAETREYYPPDTGAGAFILKCRRPNEWCDRVDLRHSGGVINLNVTAEDLLL